MLTNIIVALLVLTALAVLGFGAQQAARYRRSVDAEAQRLGVRIFVVSGVSAVMLLGLAQALRLLLAINGKL